ncbi:hypothetical protein BV20DRAFT_443390 [Pilatotrama ljubarskyi]|nr:hypothetical protein BV20DRAFT_443390 [Pilatotrama ljubarskyi]
MYSHTASTALISAHPSLADSQRVRPLMLKVTPAPMDETHRGVYSQSGPSDLCKPLTSVARRTFSHALDSVRAITLARVSDAPILLSHRRRRVLATPRISGAIYLSRIRSFRAIRPGMESGQSPQYSSSDCTVTSCTDPCDRKF